MTRRRWRRELSRPGSALLGGLLLVCALEGRPLPASEADFPPDLRAPLPALRSEDYSPGTDADNPNTGLARSLFRNTGNGFLDTLQMNPEAQAGVNAGSIQFHSQFNVGGSRALLPFFRHGFAPENADLKIGPAYFDLDSLSAALAFSDNVNLTRTHREAGAVSILELGATGILQLTDSLQFVGSGYFVYLPFVGKAGFGGSTIDATRFGFALAAFPAFYSQLTWDTNIAGWPVVFFDEFSSALGSYTLSPPDDYSAAEGAGFRGQDQVGHLVFRSPGTVVSGQNFQNPDLSSSSRDFTYFANRVGLLTERLVPGDVRLRVSAYHENLFYNQGGRGLPDIREDINVFIQSERPNLRFKPYLDYDAFRDSLDSAFNQTIIVGIRGPITDQLTFDGNVGYFFNARGGDQMVGRAVFNHEAGPYTRETLSFGQETSSFQDELFTYQTYTIDQVLGPRLNGSIFLTHDDVHDLVGTIVDREEYLAGIQLRLEAGPKTTIAATGFYTRTNSNPNFETWTGRLEIDYRLSQTLFLHLFYQYRKQDGAGPDDFRENLILLQLTKEFERRAPTP